MNINLLLLLFIITSHILINSQDILLEDPLPPCKGFVISSPTGVTKRFGYSADGGGDVNGDGIPDMIISEYQGLSTVYVIYGTKTGYSTLNVATMTLQQGFRITGLSLYGSDNTNLVSISGDVNGDDISDIVIGAGGTNGNSGAAYVIYGKKGGYADFDITNLVSPSMGFKITNPNAGYFGWNINTKVDINGDKIKDIIVGANAYDSGQGAVFVIYGQKDRETEVNIATMPVTRGFMISGYLAVNAGAAVASAGDFNQDYVDDLIVTAPSFSTLAGKSYVFYGKNGSFSNPSPLQTISTAQGFTFTGSSGQSFAVVASEAGDFNNDGVSDVVMSNWFNPSNFGQAYIFYGQKGGPPDFSTSSMTASQGIKMLGVTSGDKFGSSLASVEDINGDGITDLLIGAQGYGTNKGAVYVIFGRTDQPTTIDLSTLPKDEGFKILGSRVGGTLGYSVRSLGDINQDGVTDIIIGAPGGGRAYVLFGPNAWGCDSCSPTRKCSTCKPGYDYIYNGLCFKECPVYAPYKVGFQCFSENPVQPEVDPISDAMKDALTKSAAATNSGNKVLNVWSPGDAFPFIYGQLKTSIMYMRYLNISRTQELEELYQLYYDSDTSVLPFISMSSSIKDAFPVQPLPYMFQKYSLPSSFITNFGDDLMGLLVVFGLFIITKLAHIGVKKWIRNLPILKMFFNKASITFQNFLMGSFGELFGPIIFYSIMEYRNANKEKRYYVTSPFICFLCLVFGFGGLVISVWVLSRFHTLRKTSFEEKDKEKRMMLLESKFEGFAVFFEEFENTSLVKQSAFLLFSLKAVLESLIVGLFFDYPLFQAIMLLFLTFFLFAYSTIKRPFKSKLAFVQQMVLVFSLFICNILLSIMAGVDLSFSDFELMKKRTSKGIFWVLIMFQFIPLAFFGITMINGIWRLYKWFSSLNKPKKINVKKPHRLAKDPNQFSFSSLNQTTLSLNQSQIHFIDIETTPPKPHFAKIIRHQGENSTKDFAKKAESNRNERKNEATPVQHRKRKIARPPRKVN